MLYVYVGMIHICRNDYLPCDYFIDFLILEPPIQKINQGRISSNEWKLSYHQGKLKVNQFLVKAD